MNKQEQHKKLQEQFEQLPLPDENIAWQKMKELLKKDDDDRKPPFIYFTGCLIAGVALLIIGAIFIFAPKLFNKKTTQTEKTKNALEENKPFDSSTKNIQINTTRQNKTKDTSTALQRNISAQNTTLNKSNEPSTGKISNPDKKKHAAITKIKSSKREQANPVDHIQSNPSPNAPKKDTLTGKDLSTAKIENIPVKTDTARKQKEPAKKDSQSVVQQSPAKVSDRKPFYFGAGISLQQQIPISGQTAVPYSYFGRKFSLSDYVPAPFVRLYKDDKWFIQLEFRYGAPQATKETTYNAVTKKDSLGIVTTSTTQRLKKTWYHQVPLSFNYYVLPKLPVGIGLMYSRFDGAVSEQEVKVHNSITQTDIITKTAINIPASTDSFFTKSQLNFIIQGEYQYKHFSAGLKYRKGLQPFIRYTENGVLKEEKDYSFELFIRYQFYRSKK